MKTKPAKLLMALLLGLGCTTFASTAAFADGDKQSNDDANKSSKDESSKAATSTTGTSSVLITACGTTFIMTTHTSTVDSSTKSSEAEDKSHDSKDRDPTKDDKNDYDHAAEGHRDHVDRSAGSAHQEGDGKITICHRMGGAEVTLTVANDGWLSGHSKHALDTVGSCSDFDSKENSAKDNPDSDQKDRDAKDTTVTASDAGYSSGLTVSQIACLKGDPGTTYTGFDGQGNAFSSPGQNINNPGNPNVTITFQSANQKPSRGGARTLH